MPACENLKNEVLTYFETHFGVAAKALAGLIFQEKDQEIWATSALPCEGISSRRPSGMRILRRTPSGLKPTSTFLQLLGERITAARVEIQEINTLRRLLLGQAIPVCSSDGFVALSFRGDVLGCGLVKTSKLRVLIPTGRRKELLDALLSESN